MKQTQLIEDIAAYYQTDKQTSDHNYVQFYKHYFESIRDNNLIIAEIGILKHPARPFEGASILLWNDYF